MKKFTFCLLFSFILPYALGQNGTPKFTVPEEYEFNLPEDYEKYEPKILQTIDWYLWRSKGFDEDLREDAREFFIKWLIGSPSVTVDIQPKIVNFIEINPDLLIPFMMGWTKYALSNHSKDHVKNTGAGIVTAVDYYNKNRGYLGKDKNIEEYEKMIKKNKLENYIKKNIISSK